MVVFMAFFAAHGFSTDGAPASVFYYAGLLPWQLFASSVSSASNSLVANRSLITKVYFPRLAMPLSAIASALVDFGVSLVVLTVIMAWNRVVPTGNIVFLPLFLLLAVAAALSIGLWLSALNVEFRDVQFVIPFLVQFWMLASPVAYPSSLVPAKWRWLYGLNPMAGVIDGFRWALTGVGQPPGVQIVASTAAVIALLLGGLFFFQRVEGTVADRV